MAAPGAAPANWRRSTPPTPASSAALTATSASGTRRGDFGCFERRAGLSCA